MIGVSRIQLLEFWLQLELKTFALLILDTIKRILDPAANRSNLLVDCMIRRLVVLLSNDDVIRNQILQQVDQLSEGIPHVVLDAHFGAYLHKFAPLAEHYLVVLQEELS
jgi:hypothetical protein